MSSSEFGKLMVSEQNKWLEVIRVTGKAISSQSRA